MRYIDADKLIDKIFPIGLVDDGKYTINAKAVKVAIDKMPTADVAPKSEVERLIDECGKQSILWKAHFESIFQSAKETIKQEVAREIFEEIEKYTQEKKKAISIFIDGEDDFYDGEIHALDVFEYFLAELKKKYTESGE